jgi:phosphatidylserine/phosphatidylglycerophosphate/cardiolipin synthase-like enzyme
LKEVNVAITVTGRIVDENGAELTELTVEAVGDWLLTTERLKATETDEHGRFKLEVPELLDITDQPRPFRLRVLDITKRPLMKDRELAGDVPSQDLGDITVSRADAEGLLVTNLTGTAQFVSEGNALELLVDGEEAFGRIADDIKGAENSVDMTQLFFSVPDDFHRDNEQIDPATKEPREKAKLVFKFLGAPITPVEPIPEKDPTPRTGDERPERLLLEKALAGRRIRILLNEPGLGFPEGVFWLGVLTPLATGLGVGGVGALAGLLGIGIPFFPVFLAVTLLAYFIELAVVDAKLQDTTDVDDARHYFIPGIVATDPNNPGSRIAIRGFKQALPDHGVLHCKMVITDLKRAVVVGSPFSQRYFDVPAHRIADPRRGRTSSDMVHDLSIGVVGPAAHDLYQTFRLYWNEDLPEPEKLPDLPKPDPQPSGGNPLFKVQVTRTLSRTRFTGLGKSEKGILESYLRAFAAAKHYIYLENQYFTDSVITDALVEVLEKNSNLELILVVPIKPDVLFYPRRAAWRIEQLRKAGGERVGAFTRWTYDVKPGRPQVAPIYIHAKGAVVDDSWVTVGSANLDGLSLDYNLLLSPLAFGETTATELNISVIPPTPGAVSSFAQSMRRRLFAEHLGILKADGTPNPEDPSLMHGPEHKWLAQLWKPAAKRALEHVQAAKQEPLPGFVLEYPKEDGGWLDTPRKHLAALGVHLKPTEAVIRPITGTRKFYFSTGKWDRTPELEDIRQ